MLDLLEPCPRLWWHEVRDVGLAGLHEVEARGVVGHDLELGAGEGRGRPPVMRVAGEDETLARGPALERVGCRADHGHRPGGGGVGREHEAPGEPREQRRVGPRGAHLDPALVEHAHALERAQVAVVRPREPRGRLERARGVRGRDRAAVGEAQPGPQLEHEAAVVGCEPVRGQRRHDVEAAVECHHGVEHPATHLEAVALVRGRRVREEAGDVGPHRGAQHARVRLRRGGAAGPADERQAQDHPAQRDSWHAAEA